LGLCRPNICRVLDAEWLIDDPRFNTPENRVKNADELEAILTELFSKAKAEDC
jgi:crotonobetainyl-CoA:carnitine CoA-transferase CaiB-like acyl-CoA transferase